MTEQHKLSTLKKQLQYRIPQIKLAIIREKKKDNDSRPIRTPNDINQYAEPLKHMSEEHFVAFHLDALNNVIGYQLVSKGTLTASLVHPREVFKAALLSNAFGIIVAHNHPGGSMTPSPEDITTTKQLVKAGKLLGVVVVDHIIVSINGITSIRETHAGLWGSTE